MYRLHLSRKYQINRVGVDPHHHVTIDNSGYFCRGIYRRILPDKITTPDDKHIDVHDNFTRTDITVLIDNHGNNVRTGRTSPVYQRNTDTRTTHDTGNHSTHEFIFQQRFVYQVLKHTQQERTHENSINRLKPETRSQNLDSNCHQQKVDHEITIPDRDHLSGKEINNC